jgi:DNA-binding MarR family transcriptional regulator
MSLATAGPELEADLGLEESMAKTQGEVCIDVALGTFFPVMMVAQQRGYSVFRLALLERLRTLGEDNPPSCTDLALYARCSPQYIAGHIDFLEDEKLIARRRSDDDRRVVYVHLLPEGRSNIEAFKAACAYKLDTLIERGSYL